MEHCSDVAAFSAAPPRGRRPRLEIADGIYDHPATQAVAQRAGCTVQEVVKGIIVIWRAFAELAREDRFRTMPPQVCVMALTTASTFTPETAAALIVALMDEGWLVRAGADVYPHSPGVVRPPGVEPMTAAGA